MAILKDKEKYILDLPPDFITFLRHHIAYIENQRVRS